MSGMELKKGDVIEVRRIPSTLVSNLPKDDQCAIEQCVGKRFPISDFNDQGEVEVEFLDSENNPHTIWLDSSCVEKK
jgi:hypothetical protein